MRYLSFLFGLSLLAPLGAAAQDCKPLKIVVALAPGGGTDAVARTLAQHYTQRTGKPVIVENKVGAGGNIATEYVAKAPRDGCTLILKGAEHFLNALIYPRPGYDAKSLVAVMHAVNSPVLIAAHPGQPFKSLAALVAYAGENPGKLAYSSAGVGTGSHVATETFIRAAKIQMMHVPYKGGAPSLADVVAGVVPVAGVSISAAVPFVKSHRLVPLAVTGTSRWPTMPDVPTIAETGYPEATYLYWIGLLAPAGTPPAAREQLNQDFRALLENKAIRERLLEQGMLPVGGSVEEFEAVMARDEQNARKTTQDLKLKAD